MNLNLRPTEENLIAAREVNWKDSVKYPFSLSYNDRNYQGYLLTYMLTYITKQSPTKVANHFSTS